MLTRKFMGAPLTSSTRAQITRHTSWILSSAINDGEISEWNIDINKHELSFSIRANDGFSKEGKVVVPLKVCNIGVHNE